MVYGMVSCTHYRPYVTIDAIMVAHCPYPFHNKKTQMCYEMYRHYEQSYHMRYCLKYPIQWMERKPWKPEKLSSNVIYYQVDRKNLLPSIGTM